MRPIAILFLGSYLAWSQPPSPTPAVKGGPPKQASKNRQNKTITNELGTEKSPIVVKVLPSDKAQEETSDGKAQELRQSSSDWWMVRLSGGILAIYGIQTIVFWVQARRLKQTISKMGEIAGEQSKDIQASIAEASISAQAMERIADSIAVSVESVKSSVAITREIADRKKLIAEVQSRAYLTVLFEGMVEQNSPRRFEVRLRFANQGGTPAYNIEFTVLADVLPYPLGDDFTFPLPTEWRHSSSIAQGLNKTISADVPKTYTQAEVEQIALGVGQRIATWGIVTYQDVFNIKRFVRFAFSHYRIPSGWISIDEKQHNQSN